MRIFFLVSLLIYSKLIFSSVFTYDLNGEKITNFKSTSSQIIVDYELLIKNVDNNKVLFVPILENAFIKVSLKEFLCLQVIIKIIRLIAWEKKRSFN